jgi:hypothetical protein
VASQTMGSLVMDHFQWPEWQQIYQDAVLELDKDRLRERVAAAEAAIFSRLQALSPTVDSLSERHAIEDAQATLRILKRESLGSRDSKGQSWNETSKGE